MNGCWLFPISTLYLVVYLVKLALQQFPRASTMIDVLASEEQLLAVPLTFQTGASQAQHRCLFSIFPFCVSPSVCNDSKLPANTRFLATKIHPFPRHNHD